MKDNSISECRARALSAGKSPNARALSARKSPNARGPRRVRLLAPAILLAQLALAPLFGAAALAGPPEPPVRAPGEPVLFEECLGVACGEGGTVLLHSGEAVDAAVDLRVPGRGLDFVWARRYRSSSNKVGESTLGHNWSHSYNIFFARSADGSLRVNDGFNAPVELREIAGVFEAEGYHRSGRLLADGGLEIAFADGGRWLFRSLSNRLAPGRIDRIEDRNGNALSFSYDESSLLSTILDTLGRKYRVSHDSQGRVSTVRDFTGREVRYVYFGADVAGGSAGDLAEVHLPDARSASDGESLARVLRYTYTRGFDDEELNHNLLTVSDAAGRLYRWNRYSTARNPDALDYDRLVSQALGKQDHVSHFVYEPLPNDSSAVLRTFVNDAEGFVQEHHFDALNRRVRLRVHTRRADRTRPSDLKNNPPQEAIRADEPAHYTTVYTYNRDFHITEIIHPDGSRTAFDYEDGAGSPAWKRGRLLEIRETTPGGRSRRRTFAYGPRFAANHGGTAFAIRETDFTGVEVRHRFDDRGNEISHSHPADPAQQIDWRYNAHGQVIEHIHGQDENGERQTTAYRYYGPDDGDQNGYLAAVVEDPGGLALTTSFEYDPRGNDIRRVDARGFDTLREYGAADQILGESSELRDGHRTWTLRTYDANMNLVMVAYMNADAEHQVDPENPTLEVVYAFDTLGNNVAIIAENTKAASGAPTQEVTSLGYDRRGHLVEVRFPHSGEDNQPIETLHQSFDARGLLFREIHAQGTKDELVTEHSYNPVGERVGTVIDPQGNPRSSILTVDGWRRTVGRTDAMGNEIVNTFDDADRLLSRRRFGELRDVVGGRGNVLLAEQHLDYDATGRHVHTRTRHFDPETGKPRGDGWVHLNATLDGRGRAYLETDDLGGHRHRSYDAAGRRSQVKDATGSVQSYDRDGLGYKTRRRGHLALEDGSSFDVHAEDVFDAALERVASIDERGALRHYSFDSRGRQTQRFDARHGHGARGNAVRFEHDDRGRQLAAHRVLTDDGSGSGEPVGEITVRHVWSGNDRLLAQIDPNDNVTRQRFDARGRVVRIEQADGSFESFRYDVVGNVIEHLDANGTRLFMSYDLLDRRTEVHIEPGPGVEASTTFERFAYDGSSNLVLAADDDSEVIRGFDSIGQMTHESQNGRRTEVEVDGQGNITRVLYPSGRQIEYRRDVAGRVQDIRENRGVIAEFDYRGPTWVAHRRYPELDASSRFEHHGTGQLKRSIHQIAGTVIDDREYISDPEGLKLAEHDAVSARSRSWRHDSVGRTTLSTANGSSPSSLSYTYDPAGNWLSVLGQPMAGQRPDEICPGDYLVDPVRNVYLASPCETFLYDQAGSLIAISPTAGSANGRTRQLSYDHRRRLVSVIDSDAGRKVSLRYDVLSRLIGLDIERFSGEAPTRLEQTWLGEKVLETRRFGPAAGHHTYVHTGARDPHVIQRRDETSRDQLFYFEDDLGSIVATARLSGGTVSREHYRYGDYGAPLFFDEAGTSRAESVFGNDVLFAGMQRLEPLGLYYARTRMLDPKLGRFTTIDLAGRWFDASASGNGYVYVGNAPSSGVDRGGTWQTPSFRPGFSQNQRNSIIYNNMGRIQSRAWHLRAQMEFVFDTYWASNKRNRYYGATPMFAWFGSWSSLGSTNTLRISTVYIHRRTKNDVITFKSRTTGICGGSTLAWTLATRDAWIRLCHPQFWGLTVGTPAGLLDNRSGTILHEVAHNAGLGVADYGNAPPVSNIRGSWAENNTWHAKRNADSYEFAALDCAFGNGTHHCN